MKRVASMFVLAVAFIASGVVLVKATSNLILLKSYSSYYIGAGATKTVTVYSNQDYAVANYTVSSGSTSTKFIAYTDVVSPIISYYKIVSISTGDSKAVTIGKVGANKWHLKDTQDFNDTCYGSWAGTLEYYSSKTA